MDNNLGRADSNGPSLVVVLHVVLAQVHSVGATSTQRPGDMHRDTSEAGSDV